MQKIEFLEENRVENVGDIEFDKKFLNIITKAKSMMERIDDKLKFY